MAAMAEPGTFCRVELAVRDVTSAERFYAGLFGWELRRLPLGQGHYAQIRRGGAEVGGLYGLPAGSPDRPQWLAYVAVERLDRAARRAGELGGRVVTAPFEASDGGLMAVVEDPTGARLGLWQQGAGSTASPAGEGTLSWPELLTSDPDLAVRFYGGLFDWRAEAQGAEGARTTTFFLGQRRVAGVAPLGPSEDWVSPHWLLYFSAPDCGSASRRAEELGATVLIAPTDVHEVGCHAALADPTGAAFGLLRTG